MDQEQQNQNQKQQFQEEKQRGVMNKKISTTLGITLVALLASIVAGVAVWQNYLLLDKEVEVVEVEGQDSKKRTFIDNEIGYSFEYPIGLSLFSDEDTNNRHFKSDDFSLYISKQKVDEITKDFREGLIGYSKELALQDKEDLEKGEFGYSPEAFYIKESEKVVKIDNKVYGKEIMSLAMYEVCDVSPVRVFIFFKDDYMITFSSLFQDSKMMLEFPQYFIKDENICGKNLFFDREKDSMNLFYNYLIKEDNNPKTKVKIWYEDFDKLISTIKIF